MLSMSFVMIGSMSVISALWCRRRIISRRATAILFRSFPLLFLSAASSAVSICDIIKYFCDVQLYIDFHRTAWCFDSILMQPLTPTAIKASSSGRSLIAFLSSSKMGPFFWKNLYRVHCSLTSGSCWSNFAFAVVTLLVSQSDSIIGNR